MNPLQHCKYLPFINPADTVSDTDYTTAEIDTLGYDYATIIFHYGTSVANIDVLKVTESDSTGSGHTDITGLVVGTSDNIDGDTSSLPDTTDDDNLYVFEIDLRNRKRYLDVTATVDATSTGAFSSAICVLSRANDVPVSISDRGCEEILRV